MSKIKAYDYAFHGNGKFKIADTETKVKSFYEKKSDYRSQLVDLQDDIDALQNKMYAHNKYGMLVIFQAMDAAGKDSTMKHVFMNVHPLGTSFYSFKRPSSKELDHDFMWRCFKELPERGTIKIFNRSYYEEVLVVKVHPSILTSSQRIPDEIVNKKDLWETRYKGIRDFEEYLNNNGIVVVKLFLNVSKEEQGRRLIDRINVQEKNWKFESGDIKERALWKDYQQAYEDLINETSTKENPWHIIPADDKKNMRLMVAKVIQENLEKLDMCYPASDDARQAELKEFIAVIEGQNEN